MTRGCPKCRTVPHLLALATLVAMFVSATGSTAGPGQGAVAPAPGEPAFEVASIRPAPANSGGRGLIDASIEAEIARAILADARKGRFSARGVTLHTLIQLAYDVRAYQVQGGPSWMRSERFVIEATAPGTPSVDDVRGMLRSLLADRFRLTLHRDTRSRPVYELVPARRGLKIAPMKEGDCIAQGQMTSPVPMNLAKPVYICEGFRRMIVTLPPDRTDRVEAGGIAMAFLTGMLSDDLGRMVIDRTGVTERFNLLLDFAPTPEGVGSAASSGPTIFAALEEHLGLRLRATSAPVEVVAIDRAERPSEN